MRSIKIDEYHYCRPNQKKELYNKESYSEDEMNKTRAIRQRIFEYKKIVGRESYIKLPTDEILEYVCSDDIINIRYNENIGYISTTNGMDNDIVDIYYYGDNEEEAFLNSIIDYEFSINQNYEARNRDALINEYARRFPDKEYQIPFVFTELSLQDLRKYYGNSIPDSIIEYYEEYLSRRLNEPFKYDYNSDSLVSGNKLLIKD